MSCSGRHRASDRRTIHLLDVENLLGGDVSPQRCGRVWSQYRATVGVDRDDQVVVAVAQHNAAVAAFNLPSNVCRVVGGNDPDGAECALLDAVDISHLTARFDRIIIGSDARRFARVAAAIAAAGCEVAQVLGVARCIPSQPYAACPTSYVLPIRHGSDATWCEVSPANGAKSSMRLGSIRSELAAR